MIELNRISRLLHKMTFFARQRNAVGYSHKYVISAKDAMRDIDETTKTQRKKNEDEQSQVAKVLDGFDPANNELDRRILYEVTGMRLRSSEFRDEDSSDSSGDQAIEELLPSDYAFMDRFTNEEEGDQSQKSALI